MKLLTVYTNHYEQALTAFAAEAENAGRLSPRSEGRRDGLFYLCCAYAARDSAITDGFAALLEYVAIQENPVYRYSPKLTDLAKDLQRTPVHFEILSNLTQYLKTNKTLHLEGYVTFRMADYREKLDILSYSLIKKMELGRGWL